MASSKSKKSTRNTAKNKETRPATGTSVSKAGHGQIAERAYQIWQENGRPMGQDLNDWLQAEREID
jgi:hypothetical protein